MTTAPVSIQTQLQQAFKRIVGGLPINSQNTSTNIRVRKYTFWHRIAYPAGGATSFQFFNAPKQRFVTNMPQAGSLPGGYYFAGTSLGLRLTQGIDLAGAAQATGTASTADAASIVPLTLAEQMRLIYSSGHVRMIANGITEVDEHGIDAFPLGRGMDGAAAVASTDTGISAGLAIFNNGSPHLSNKREFSPLPVAIEPGASFEVSVEFPAALPLTGGGVFECFLEGLLVTPPSVA